MGLLLSLIGIGLGAATVQGLASASDVHQGWMTSQEKENFDQMNARDGIHAEQIENIARRCKIKTNKWGVLPSDGWQDCLYYVRKYANSEDDIDVFIENWKKTFKHQYEIEMPKKIKNAKNAQKHSKYESSIKDDINSPYTIKTYEITHWKGITKEEHIKRMEKLCNDTCLKHVLQKPPILRWSSDRKDMFTEFWVIRVPRSPGNLVCNPKAFKNTYKICCEHLGYDSEL